MQSAGLKLALAGAAIMTVVACVSLGPTGTAVPVQNASFELPAREGNGVDSDGWTSGGRSYGRFRYPSWVADGEWAVWSAYDGGTDNGYSQQLAENWATGSYRLAVAVAGADPLGGVSRIVLGYLDDGGLLVELGHADSETQKMTWGSQRLVVEVPESSPAIGKPIVIWLTCAAMGPVKGAAGNIWDKVSLMHYPPVPAKQ